MIGFNNHGFAGKTRQELAAEREAERAEWRRVQCVDELGDWICDHEARLEEITRHLESFSFLHCRWFWLAAATQAAVFMALGACLHIILSR